MYSFSHQGQCVESFALLSIDSLSPSLSHTRRNTVRVKTPILSICRRYTALLPMATYTVRGGSGLNQYPFSDPLLYNCYTLYHTTHSYFLYAVPVLCARAMCPADRLRVAPSLVQPDDGCYVWCVRCIQFGIGFYVVWMTLSNVIGFAMAFIFFTGYGIPIEGEISWSDLA